MVGICATQTGARFPAGVYSWVEHDMQPLDTSAPLPPLGATGCMSEGFTFAIGKRGTVALCCCMESKLEILPKPQAGESAIYLIWGGGVSYKSRSWMSIVIVANLREVLLSRTSGSPDSAYSYTLKSGESRKLLAALR